MFFCFLTHGHLQNTKKPLLGNSFRSRCQFPLRDRIHSFSPIFLQTTRPCRWNCRLGVQYRGCDFDSTDCSYVFSNGLQVHDPDHGWGLDCLCFPGHGLYSSVVRFLVLPDHGAASPTYCHSSIGRSTTSAGSRTTRSAATESA